MGEGSDAVVVEAAKGIGVSEMSVGSDRIEDVVAIDMVIDWVDYFGSVPGEIDVLPRDGGDEVSRAFGLGVFVIAGIVEDVEQN